MSDARTYHACQKRRHRSLREDDGPLPRGSAANRPGRRELTASSSRMLARLYAGASSSESLSGKRTQTDSWTPASFVRRIAKAVP